MRDERFSHGAVAESPYPRIAPKTRRQARPLGPAPRSADGKPDLSGVWRVKQTTYLTYVTSDLKPEEIQPWAAAIYINSARTIIARTQTESSACRQAPKPAFREAACPMKIVQTPNLVVVLYEYQTLFRQIFTDGRALPEDPNPTWMGYSIGHWEGDTLVVTTAGYNDRTTIDLGGHPHTEALRVTERFHRRDVGHLDLQVTLDDPKAYTRPWTLPVELDLMPDGELIEYVCENERDKPHLVGKSGEEFRVPAEVLAQYAGTYGTDIVVSLEGSRLTIDSDGGGKIPLIAHSETSFTMEGTGVDFVCDAKGAAIAMIQHWVEGDRYFARAK